MLEEFICIHRKSLPAVGSEVLPLRWGLRDTGGGRRSPPRSAWKCLVGCGGRADPSESLNQKREDAQSAQRG